MNQYMSIPTIGHNATLDNLIDGELITVFEKIDGANASFRQVWSDSIECYGRDFTCNRDKNLRGFFQWVHTHINPFELFDGLQYYGEWLKPHTMEYYPDSYGHFYLFDIFDHNTGKYLPPSAVKVEAERLGLRLDPILYRGPYKGQAHLESLVGKSELGPQGEGIIVKVARTGQYYKMVIPLFFETTDFRPESKTDPISFVEDVCPPARVIKFIHKFVDESLIPEDYGMEHYHTIVGTLTARLVDDIYKEDAQDIPDLFNREDIVWAISMVIPGIVKQLIK